MRKLLTGNEAIARGAYEAGVRVACAYPGTPSTEILENIAQYPEIDSQWATNEKVSVEVAQGASIAGARVLVAMKHVGVNVAADPLFTLGYNGVNGGFVFVSADDPGMHSSQNEQDNRYYAKFMKAVLLEPSDSQEAKDLVGQGLAISEQFDTPVMLRTTTRISHSKSMVSLSPRQEIPLKSYEKNPVKNFVMPAHQRIKRPGIEERLQRLAKYADTFPGNRVEKGGAEFAVITSGPGYLYAKEALGDRATYLKLTMTWPLPAGLIGDFIDKYGKVYLIEEGEPFLEEQIKALGLSVIGKDLFPRIGELSAAIVREKLLGTVLPRLTVDCSAVPGRPPVLCAGCPHRGVFAMVSKTADIVTSDIGCYSLGFMPPLSVGDTCIDMGASIPNALGFAKIMPDRKIVATIGDSTFLHSGITGLIDLVYNRGAVTVVILDNRITGMTGHQQNPASGFDIHGKPAPQVDLEQIVRACGITSLWTVDAYDLAQTNAALQAALATGGPAVVIAKRPCILIQRNVVREPLEIAADLCKRCKACLKVGCPAIEFTGGDVRIDPVMCTGCGVCRQVCKFGAMRKAGAAQ
jgi:indolepyruvate ferredoxin oxidoreductase alpha subunit